MKPENMNAIIVDISSLIQTSPERLEISEGVPGSTDSFVSLKHPTSKQGSSTETSRQTWL
jgi:hypothetical protein